MKNNFKRFLSLLLALLLCAGLLPTFALAGDMEEPAPEVETADVPDTEAADDSLEEDINDDTQLPSETAESPEPDVSEDIFPESADESENELEVSFREPEANENILTSEFFPDAFLLEAIKSYYSASEMTASVAAAKTTLYADGTAEAGVTNITGLVRFFPNLSTLSMRFSRFTSVDLKGLTELTFLDLRDNRLRTLDLSGMTNLNTLYLESQTLPDTTLEYADFSKTGIQYLNFYRFENLKSINCAGCFALNEVFCDWCERLVSVNFADCVKLSTLYCSHSSALTTVVLTNCGSSAENPSSYEIAYCTSLKSLDLSGCTKLDRLHCDNSTALAELKLDGAVSLQELDCSYCALTSLDLSSQKGSLATIYCNHNCLSELNLNGFTALKYVNCQYNTIRSLDVSGCSVLKKLYIDDNCIDKLSLSGSFNLEELTASGAGISSIDLSGMTKLGYITLGRNKLRKIDISDCPATSVGYNNVQYPDVRHTAYRVDYDAGFGNKFYIIDLAEFADFSAEELEKITDSYVEFSGFASIVASDSNHIFVLIDGTSYLENLKNNSYDPQYYLRYDYRYNDTGYIRVCADIEFSEQPFFTGLNKDYLIMSNNALSGPTLKINTVFGELPACFDVEWKSSDSDIIVVNDGALYHSGESAKFGTAEVTAKVSITDEYDNLKELKTLSARVDVTKGSIYGSNGIVRASLPVGKATVQLFSTQYTEFDVMLELEQNLEQFDASLGILPEEDVPVPASEGTAIVGAEFSDPAVAKYFNLVPAGDRTLKIVPVYDRMAEIYNSPKTYKIPSTLKSKVTVRIKRGEDPLVLTTEQTLTISVKQSRPSVKTKAITLNSYPTLSGLLVPVTLSGGTITGVSQDSVAPDWLKYDVNTCSVAYIGPANAKLKTNLKLLCTLDGWAVEAPVTVKISTKPTAPSVKFSSKSVTLAGSADDFVIVKYSVNSPFEGNEIYVNRITEGKGKNLKEYLNIDDNNNIFVTSASSYHPGNPEYGRYSGYFTVEINKIFSGAHTYTVWFGLAGKEFPLTVKVTDSAKLLETVTLKTSGAIDLGIEGSTLNITATVKGLADSNDDKYTPGKIYRADDPTQADVSGSFNCDPVLYTNRFTLTAKYPYTGISSGKYVIEFSRNLGYNTAYGKCTFTVKNTPAEKFKPYAKLKVTGWIDPLRENQKAYFKVSFVNSPQSMLDNGSVVLYYKNGKEYVKINGIYSYYDDETGLLSMGANFYANTDGVGKKVYARYEGTIINNGGPKPIPVVSAYVPVKYKTAKISSTLIASNLTLSLKDCHDRACFTLKPKEEGERLLRYEYDDVHEYGGVAIASSVYANMFDLVDEGGGNFSIRWKDGKLPLVAPKAGKTISLKLNIYVAGNYTGKPNTSVTVKIKIV